MRNHPRQDVALQQILFIFHAIRVPWALDNPCLHARLALTRPRGPPQPTGPGKAGP